MGELIRTGGTFAGRDAAIAVGEWPRYFLAGKTGDMANILMPDGVGLLYRDILQAVNELTPSTLVTLESLLDAGARVFLDSGVFNLANGYAVSRGIPLFAALATPPDQMDGFDDLFSRYVDLVRRYGDRAWGYVEFDLGGTESKVRLRAKLEAAGLRPIPVFHPFTDGWDYFDELASKYDRICIGNLATAGVSERRKLLVAAWQRKRKYPHLWIHLLGYSPNEFMNAFPIDSADSSSWLRMVRWAGSHRESSMLKATTGLPLHFRYRLGEPRAVVKSNRMSGYTFHHAIMSWRHHLRVCESLGFDLLPPVA